MNQEEIKNRLNYLTEYLFDVVGIGNQLSVKRIQIVTEIQNEMNTLEDQLDGPYEYNF